mmetsp:Transcript_20861/g.49014  ORF Transcript_20861/g.49014 Transcript_20861/m.49014 type:complete len:465 (-) Transcript_20861:32-1426(-)
MAAPSPNLLAKGLPILTPTALNPHAPVGKWILGTSSLVCAMVHIGGVTRLTKSGLSMTDWKPLGSRPPITNDEWLEEFERYKQFPEWQQRQSMSLDEFKYIYFWEWGHRMAGRFVGLVFGGGWLYFTWLHRPKLQLDAGSSLALPKNVTSAIPPGYQGRLALLFGMGGFQGLVGWWMVKSGLGQDRMGDRREIRVSPYRLTAHLGMAVSTYSLLLWTGLNVLSFPVDKYVLKSVAGDAAKVGTKTVSYLQEYARSLTPSALTHARRTRLGVLSTVGLTGLTILSGGFVAGNDAGCAYNTYPLMDGELIPWGDLVDPQVQPAWRNLFETTAAVQFNHRVLGTTTALSALGVAAYGLAKGQARSVTPQVRRGLLALGTAATGQMSLGIATLLNYVPLHLAASHQLGSLVVLTCGIYSAHSLRYAGHGVIAKVGSRAVSSLVSGGGGVGSAQKSTVAVSRVINNVKI